MIDAALNLSSSQYSKQLPVHGDCTQIENGGGGAHDVEGDPNVAELRAEHPEALEIISHGEHHDEAGNKQITDGQ